MAEAARVAVIGGGWAGCAAAVTLAQARIPVTLFEQAKTLGGRARRVVQDGLALDNGSHLLIGAYRQTLDLITLVHGREHAASLFHRLPLTIRPFAPHPGAVGLSAWPLPAPFHLLAALLRARGLDARERRGLIASFVRLQRAGFRVDDSLTVAQCFAATPPRAFAAVWEPLCLAALNTPPDAASARVFAAVLRAAFTGAASNSAFHVPAADLSACFPDAAARYVREHDGVVLQGVGVRAIAFQGARQLLHTANGDESFDALVVAVGPHQLAAAIGSARAGDAPWRDVLARIDAFRYESITTIYLGFDRAAALAGPLLRLDDAPGQWLFECSAARGAGAPADVASVVAVVISAGGAHDHLDHPTLAANVESQLRRLAPQLPRVTWSRVIAERRATYACTPGLRRPAPGRIAPRVYLAGDYCDQEFPATLEAATRSGVAAAKALIDDWRAFKG